MFLHSLSDKCAKPRPGHRTPLTGPVNLTIDPGDRHELVCAQRGAADERPIDIFDPQQFRGIGGLDRTAIENPKPARPGRQPVIASARIKPCISAMSSGVGVSPLPIAQTGS